MPHGDFSDFAGFGCAALGLTATFRPDLFFHSSVGPINPFFDGEYDDASDSAATLQLAGALFMYVFFTLYVVRWNTLNGKAGGIGCFTVGTQCVRIAWKMDNGVFNLRMWHLVAALMFFASFHLIFNANAMWTSKTLAAHEKAKADKKGEKKA